MALAILGMGVFVTAKIHLGEHYSHCFDSYVPKGIVTVGIYKFIRHPIYSGNLVMLFGLSVASGSFVVFLNFLITSYFYFKSAVLEEKALERKFPDYVRYKENTGRYFPTW